MQVLPNYSRNGKFQRIKNYTALLAAPYVPLPPLNFDEGKLSETYKDKGNLAAENELENLSLEGEISYRSLDNGLNRISWSYAFELLLGGISIFFCFFFTVVFFKKKPFIQELASFISRSGYFCLCNLFFPSFVSFWFDCSLFSSSCFLNKCNFAVKLCSPFLYVCEKQESGHLKCSILLFRLPLKASNCRAINQSVMEKGHGTLLWNLLWRNRKGILPLTEEFYCQGTFTVVQGWIHGWEFLNGIVMSAAEDTHRIAIPFAQRALVKLLNLKYICIFPILLSGNLSQRTFCFFPKLFFSSFLTSSQMFCVCTFPNLFPFQKQCFVCFQVIVDLLAIAWTTREGGRGEGETFRNQNPYIIIRRPYKISDGINLLWSRNFIWIHL